MSSKGPKLLAFRGNDIKKSKRQREQESKIKQISYRQAMKALNNNAETKFWLFNDWSGGVSSTTTIGIGDMSLIPQETSSATDSVRVGDEVRVSSIQFRYYLTCADTTNVIRLILFQWHQDDTPAGSDILGSTSQPLTSPYRKDTKGHYTILWDKTHHLTLGNNSVVGGKGFISRGFKRKIRYDAATTTGQGKFFLLNVSDSSAATHPYYYWTFQINYKDY